MKLSDKKLCEKFMKKKENLIYLSEENSFYLSEEENWVFSEEMLIILEFY